MTVEAWYDRKNPPPNFRYANACSVCNFAEFVLIAEHGVENNYKCNHPEHCFTMTASCADVKTCDHFAEE